MNRLRAYRRVSTVLAFTLFALRMPVRLMAQQEVVITQITPTLLVFATSSGNVVASVGPDGALLIGTPSASSTPSVSSAIAQHTKSLARYLVIYPESASESEGDAGWGRLGAFVAMHENALRRLGGNVMGAPGPPQTRLAERSANRPSIAFSEVLAFDLNGDSIHIVHQKPGYSDADALAHFHVANLFYLGEAFPGDGYPLIDAVQGGTLEGLLDQLIWTDGNQRIVPARGKVTDGTSLKAFRDMIVTVRDRVRHMVNDGRTESQVLAAHLTADLDQQWGHGRVSPDSFVREVYAALKR